MVKDVFKEVFFDASKRTLIMKNQFRYSFFVNKHFNYCYFWHQILSFLNFPGCYADFINWGEKPKFSLGRARDINIDPNSYAVTQISCNFMN